MNTFLKDKKAYIIFIAPALLIYTFVIAFPAIQTLLMSFTQWDGLNPPQFIGLDNFKNLLESKALRQSITNGIKYSLMIAFYQIGFGTLFANIINQPKLRGKKFFRTSFFIPVVLSMAVVAQLWINIYHGEFGLINGLFEAMGIEYRQYWLFQPKTSLYAVAFVDSWKGMGYHFILIYAGLRAIPESYFEAALIDGANAWQTFKSITLPLMAQTYKVSLTLTLTWGFRAFDSINIMTQGGPGTSSATLPILIYKGIYSLGDYGYAAAISVILLLQCLLVMFLVEKYFGKKIDM